MKKLPELINKPITDISCNQDIFDDARSIYEEALQNSGFNDNVKYKKTRIVRGKLGMKKRGRHAARSYGLIHPFPLA